MTTATIFDQAGIDRIRVFAERPENLYRMPGADFVPGQRPDYVAEVQVIVANPNVGVLRQRIRTVFTISEMDGRRFRHASFSLLTGDTSEVNVQVGPGTRLQSEGLPAPSAVEALCIGLGFTGRLANWTVGQPQDEAGVIIAVQDLMRVA